MVQIGLALETLGLIVVATVVSDHVSFWSLIGPFVLFGVGIGFASSQLTNVILSEISKDKSGVASGANTTVRQTGNALGTAVIGSVLTAQTVRHASAQVRASTALPAAVKAQALAQLKSLGANYSPPAGLPGHQFGILSHALAGAVAAGIRPAMLFAAGVVACGAVLSLLIPPVGAPDPARDHRRVLRGLRAHGRRSGGDPGLSAPAAQRPTSSASWARSSPAAPSLAKAAISAGGSRQGSASVPARASWIALHTRSGVQGMSMWRMPRWLRASTTAFCTAGVEPTVADSPMPLAPRSFNGEGVWVCAVV